MKWVFRYNWKLLAKYHKTDYICSCSDFLFANMNHLHLKGLSIGPPLMPREASPPDSYKSDRHCFSSLDNCGTLETVSTPDTSGVLYPLSEDIKSYKVMYIPLPTPQSMDMKRYIYSSLHFISFCRYIFPKSKDISTVLLAFYSSELKKNTIIKIKLHFF